MDFVYHLWTQLNVVVLCCIGKHPHLWICLVFHTTCLTITKISDIDGSVLQGRYQVCDESLQFPRFFFVLEGTFEGIDHLHTFLDWRFGGNPSTCNRPSTSPLHPITQWPSEILLSWLKPHLLFHFGGVCPNMSQNGLPQESRGYLNYTTTGSTV